MVHVALFRAAGSQGDRQVLRRGPAFHFPSRAALQGGCFDTERGRHEIRHDIRRFLSGIPPRPFAVAWRIAPS
jgi:hypothetical protein